MGRRSTKTLSITLTAFCNEINFVVRETIERKKNLLARLYSVDYFRSKKIVKIITIGEFIIKTMMCQVTDVSSTKSSALSS